MASARAWVFTVFLLACLLAGPADGWGSRRRRRSPPPCKTNTAALPGALNTWDATFTFECPWNKAISRIKSVHCNTAEDRVWRFECKDAVGISLSQHYWTGWINDYDGDMNFNCPFNSVVTGFKSEHSNSHEDRRWKVKCSKKFGMRTDRCHSTWFANDFDNAMNIGVPATHYVTGMHGYHSNIREDRRYRFTLCRVTP